MSNVESKIANERFDRARFKEMFNRILNVLTPDNQALLSLQDIQGILKDAGESYGGIRAIPIRLIVGSEGRYRDFSNKFMPRYESLRGRWTSIDRAHQRDTILPAITVYEIGGLYFVRDGNHRVSVAKMLGMVEIDAEVITLSTPLRLEKPANKPLMKRQVIEFERRQFLKQIEKKYHPEFVELQFTETGRYAEIGHHINSHKGFLERQSRTSSFSEACISWKRHLFLPIVNIIEEENILSRFHGRTAADLYVWIIKHGNSLPRTLEHRRLSVREVILDLSKRFGRNPFQRFSAFLKRNFR